MSIFRKNTAELPTEEKEVPDVKVVKGDEAVIVQEDEDGNRIEKKVKLPKTKWA
jgi:hypothetical protein